MLTVPDLLRTPGLHWGEKRTVVSFVGATEIDSAALALMLQWRREAQSQGRQVIFDGLSDNLKTLMNLYGMNFLMDDLGVGERE